MTLKPAPVQVPFKPASSPSGLSGVWTEENRNGLSIEGIGVKAKSGLSSIFPSRFAGCAQDQPSLSRPTHQSKRAPEIQPGATSSGFRRQLSLRGIRSTQYPDAATSVT